jgi:RHS repeat-associated protein
MLAATTTASRAKRSAALDAQEEMLARHCYDAARDTNYNYFRNYDPSIGRYVESDPEGIDSSLNTYGYVEAGPLNYSDPLGLQIAVPLPPPPPGKGGTWGGSGTGYGESSGWGHWGSWGGSDDSSSNIRDFDHNPGKEPCGKCRSCMPPAGTLCYSILHVDRSHFPMDKHYHMFRMNQDKDCNCRWNPEKKLFRKGVIYPRPENAIRCPFSTW